MPRDLTDRPTVKRSRTCESCGSEFECSVGLNGCWCSKVDLTDAARADLAGRYTDCLCPACLNDVSSLDRGAR